MLLLVNLNFSHMLDLHPSLSSPAANGCSGPNFGMTHSGS
jgi:hypothetical protein